MQPIESLNLLLLNVGMARHQSDWNWKDVSSPFTRIYLVTEGEAYIHFANHETLHLTPGHLYIVPAYSVHSYECTGLFTHYYMHVYEGYKKDIDVLDMYELPYEVAAGEMDAEMLRRMCENYPELQLPASNPISYDNSTRFASYVQRYNALSIANRMEIRGSILLLVSRFLKNAQLRQWGSDERMKKVLKYIHTNLTEEITIEQLADMSCVTKPYFIRLFKNEMGISPIQYINQKKIEKAQLLLVTEKMSIKAIAYTVGFNDHSYFSRLFHKLTGRSPQEYRDMMR